MISDWLTIRKIGLLVCLLVIFSLSLVPTATLNAFVIKLPCWEHTNCLEHTPQLGHRPSGLDAPGPSIEPYIRADLAKRMRGLHTSILRSAAAHNRPELSGLSNAQFAEVLVVVLYNEHNGWLEDDVEPLRLFTPLYQYVQTGVNRSGIGSNFSVWPANLRPSVAWEILQQQVPVPAPTGMITVPLHVHGSQIILEEYTSQEALFAAITAEICQDELAIEYLATNLERGLYRAAYEDVPVSWRTLTAWHNQGIVHPQEIQANPLASTYVQRASAYLPLAATFVEQARRLNSPDLPGRRGLQLR